MINLKEKESVVSIEKVRKTAAQIDGEEVEISEKEDIDSEES